MLAFPHHYLESNQLVGFVGHRGELGIESRESLIARRGMGRRGGRGAGRRVCRRVLGDLEEEINNCMSDLLKNDVRGEQTDYAHRFLYRLEKTYLPGPQHVPERVFPKARWYLR